MKLQMLLERVEDLGGGVKEFRFTGSGCDLPPFSAGSSLRIDLPVGRGLSNAYSLAGDPAERGSYTIAVRKESAGRSKGGSVYLHERAAVGEVFTASPPENHFAPVRTARRHLLVAGGIGATPFAAFEAELARWGAEREAHYVYRGTGPLAERLGARGGRVVLHDTARTGRPDFRALLEGQPAGTHVYVCGPAGMIRDVAEAAVRAGWPEEAVHSERFSAPVAAPGREFTARLARTGAEVRVASGETLLEALEREGLGVPFSCRVGGCGTCRVGVVRGGVEHRDTCLTDSEREEGRAMMACVSRAENGEVVLDL